MVNPLESKKFVTFTVDMIVQAIIFAIVQFDPSLESTATEFGKLGHELAIALILAFMVQDVAKEMGNKPQSEAPTLTPTEEK